MRNGTGKISYASEIIAQAGGKNYAGQEQRRWHEITVYWTFYTRQAVELAKRNQVELCDRDKLVTALASIRKEQGGARRGA
jgi:HJR/Mrr/RecB family endonuclease